MSTEQASTASSHPSAVGRIRRTASPVWPPSRASCGGDEPRAGNAAAPRSRMPARCTATAVTRISKTSTGSNAVGSGSVSGRDSSIQPSRLSHTSQCRPGFEALFRQAEPVVSGAIARGELPADTDPAELVRTLLAPIYLRLLVTAEPIDRTTADNAAKVALAAARGGALSSDPA